MDELRTAYTKMLPALNHAKLILESLLQEAAGRIEDKKLVRAVVDSIRIKEEDSAAHKAKRGGWITTEALTKCSDLVGGRVVCNNIEDVYRFAELLKEQLPTFWNTFEIQDYIQEPKGGYRALHVNFRLNVSENLSPELVPCEVQIRSLLQHAWAELSHADIYKQHDLPEDLRDRTGDLAAVLAAADTIASGIRSRAVSKSAVPEQSPSIDHVSADGLAFVFRNVFGRSPKDYTVRQALNLCDTLGVTSLEPVINTLGNAKLRARLAGDYQGILGVPLDNETLFLTIFYAAARGEKQALQRIRRQARRELREIERISNTETLSNLPDTIEEIIERFEDFNSDADIVRWAGTFGATHECDFCNVTIIEPDALSEAFVHHYELPEAEAEDAYDRLVSAIYGSGVETGGPGNSSLCGYCNAQANRDD